MNERTNERKTQTDRQTDSQTDITHRWTDVICTYVDKDVPFHCSKGLYRPPKPL